MKTNLRFVSPLLVVIAACSIPLLGCKRLATEAIENAADRATEVAFEEGSDGGMDVRLWHLTNDFPKSAPIDPKSDLLSSASIDVGHDEKGWMAAFQTDESAKQVLAFYDSKMHRMSAGDAGRELADLEAQMSTQSVQLLANGSQISTTSARQEQATTPFDFGSQGMLILKTYDTKAPGLKPERKNVMFTIMIVNGGRPKS